MNNPHASPSASIPDTLDLGAIPGVPEHFDRTGQLPILVFRAPRRVLTVLSPFPGVWKLISPADSRCMKFGTNTYASVIELQAGDELAIVPLMSTHGPAGPRIQVPAELVNDIGELESIDDLPEVADDQPIPDDGPTDDDIDHALGWHFISHLGGAQCASR